MSEYIAMDLVGVRVQFPSNQPIVLLREREGFRYLPIWVGAVEATAIAYAMEGVVPDRPMTHDLLRNVTQALGAEVKKVLVTELRDSVYFADLVFASEEGDVTISSRPSDAIALAARTGAGVFATEEVLEDAGIELEEENEETEIEKFREFLDDISPDDFEGSTD
jgi:bifunctional DNase/RNase